MATVIGEGVERPSISPDGRYLAFQATDVTHGM
jgi:hypothetical protein